MDVNTTDAAEGPENSQPGDDEIIRFIATSPHPVATTKIADHFDLPRSTTWDLLNPLEDAGKIESWNPNSQARLWTVPGQYGDASLVDVYHAAPLTQFLETGKFPPDTDVDLVAGMLDEAFMELAWNTQFGEAVHYSEFKQIAELLNISVAALTKLSPADIQEYVRSMSEDDIPREPQREDASTESPVAPESLIDGNANLDDDVMLSGGHISSLENNERFKEIRKDQLILQGDVADSAGIAQSIVSQWENGKKSLNSEKLVRLWRTLDTFLSDGASE